MKTTVKKTETTHVVALAVEGMTDADVMKTHGRGQSFYPDNVTITYKHVDGEWKMRRTRIEVSGPRQVKAGRSEKETRVVWFGVSKFDTDTPEWVRVLVEQHRPSWTPQTAQA